MLKQIKNEVFNQIDTLFRMGDLTIKKIDFLHKKVHSEKYGDGTIINVDETVFNVEFADVTKSFNYMIAFKNKALSFVEKIDQDELIKWLEIEKMAQEQKHHEIKKKQESEERQKEEIKHQLFLTIESALSGDGRQLIGDFEFNTDDLDYLKDIFKKAYFKNGESVTNLTKQEVKAFLIVMINRLRDYEKPWKEFSELLSSFFDNISLFDAQSKITNLYNKIDNIFSECGRVLFKTKTGKRAFEQTFLYQALAPVDSIQSFIKLAWSLYLDEDILDSSYTEPDLELCKKVVETLSMKFSKTSGEEDIQFSGASYGIKAGLKYGCEQNAEKTAELLNRIFEYIHRVDHYSEEITENHLGIIVTDVINKAKQIIIRSNSSGKRKNVSKYVHSFDEVKPTFYLERNQNENPRVLLCFPKVIILNSNSNLQYVEVEIVKYYSNGKSKERIYTHPSQWIKRNETCQTLRAFEIDITDLLVSCESDLNLEVVLKIKNEFEYEERSSGKSLFRDYIIFNETQEIKKNSRPGIFCLIAPKKFNPSENMCLFENECRMVSNGIYFFRARELDFINFGNTKTLFGSNKMSTSVLFKEEEIERVEEIFFIPDMSNQDYDVPVVRKFSDVYIINEKSIMPSSIRITHKTKDSKEGIINKSVKVLNELSILDGRYYYSKEDNHLDFQGWHSIEIVKCTANGTKSLLNASEYEYFLDESAKVICDKIAYLKNNVPLTVCIMGETYEKSINYLETSVLIETKHGLFKVIPPYLRWKFLDDDEYKYKPCQVPFFISDFPSGSILDIDASIEIKDVIFMGNNKKCYVVDRANSEKNRFLVSQFLVSHNEEKGEFFALTQKFGKLLLFKVVKNPYFKEENLVLDYENGILTYDFSQAFIHDKKDYYMKLRIGTEEDEDPFELEDLSVDKEEKIEIEDLKDGEYTIRIYYYTTYSGMKGEERIIPLVDDFIMLGDDVKAKIYSAHEITLQKCKISDETTRKFKDTFITDQKFLYTDGEYRVFEGILNRPRTKKAKIIFYVSNITTIRKIYFVFNNDFSQKKEAHYDVQNNDIVCSDLSEGKIVFMSSIYVKKLGGND